MDKFDYDLVRVKLMGSHVSHAGCLNVFWMSYCYLKLINASYVWLFTTNFEVCQGLFLFSYPIAVQVSDISIRLIAV